MGKCIECIKTFVKTNKKGIVTGACIGAALALGGVVLVKVKKVTDDVALFNEELETLID